MAGPYVPGPAGDKLLATVYGTTGNPLTWQPYFESAFTEREAVLGSGDGTGGLLPVRWKFDEGLYETAPVLDVHTRITRGDEVICDLPWVIGWSQCWMYGAGQYKVRMDTSQQVLPTSTRTSTEWDLAFDPDAGAVPPLVFATYQLPVDLCNRASDDDQRVSLKVGYQPGGPPSSASWKVGAWATFDDGQTWKPVYDKTIGSDGRFSPEIDPPDRTNGYVGLRVRADDGRGNTIDQTVIRAYALDNSQ